jgi:hypothetical protein
MIPRFSKQINQWADNLHKSHTRGGQTLADKPFLQDAEQTSKLLAFRLIAMSIYGEALDEKVCDLLHRCWEMPYQEDAIEG